MRYLTFSSALRAISTTGAGQGCALVRISGADHRVVWTCHVGRGPNLPVLRDHSREPGCVRAVPSRYHAGTSHRQALAEPLQLLRNRRGVHPPDTLTRGASWWRADCVAAAPIDFEWGEEGR